MNSTRSDDDATKKFRTSSRKSGRRRARRSKDGVVVNDKQESISSVDAEKEVIGAVAVAASVQRSSFDSNTSNVKIGISRRNGRRRRRETAEELTAKAANSEGGGGDGGGVAATDQAAKKISSHRHRRAKQDLFEDEVDGHSQSESSKSLDDDTPGAIHVVRSKSNLNLQDGHDEDTIDDENPDGDTPLLEATLVNNNEDDENEKVVLAEAISEAESQKKRRRFYCCCVVLPILVVTGAASTGVAVGVTKNKEQQGEGVIVKTINTTEMPSTSLLPSTIPSVHPSSRPSSDPSVQPSFRPTLVPSSIPSLLPTESTMPTQFPTGEWAWRQIGLPINGLLGAPNTGDFGNYETGKFGSSLSLSFNGRTLAAAFGESQTFTFRRQKQRMMRELGQEFFVYSAKVYDCNILRDTADNDRPAGCEEIDWFGDDYGYDYIYEEGPGPSLDLSSDGTRVALASYWGDLLVSNPLSCTGIASDTGMDGVALSGEGDFLAIWKRDEFVSIYELGSTQGTCIEKSSELSPSDDEGTEVAFSFAKSGMAYVTASNNETDGCVGIENLPYKGYSVRAYIYDRALDRWMTTTEINGEETESVFPSAIAMSFDGRTMAIGVSRRERSCEFAVFASRQDFGHVRVLRYNDEDQSWVDISSSLLSSSEQGDMFGVSVALSDDGTILAVGASAAKGQEGFATDSGRTSIYEQLSSSQDNNNDESERSTEWVQFGESIYGLPTDSSGETLALSGDGRTVAIGAPNSDLHGDGTGTVRIYHFSNLGRLP